MLQCCRQEKYNNSSVAVKIYYMAFQYAGS